MEWNVATHKHTLNTVFQHMQKSVTLYFISYEFYNHLHIYSIQLYLVIVQLAIKYINYITELRCQMYYAIKYLCQLSTKNILFYTMFSYYIHIYILEKSLISNEFQHTKRCIPMRPLNYCYSVFIFMDAKIHKESHFFGFFLFVFIRNLWFDFYK